jgi:hypothetical protein
MLRSKPKEAFSKLRIAVSCRAWATIKTIGAVAHRLCRLIWLILRKGVRYEERGPAVSQRSRQNRTSKMIRELRMLGYRVEFLNAVPSIPIP